VAAAVVALLSAYPVVVAILSVINVVAPQRNGPLAISQVAAPHLLLGVLLLVPLLRLTPSSVLRVGIVAAVALGAVRFGPGLISIGQDVLDGGDSVLTIASWNLEVGSGLSGDLIDLIDSSDAVVVALQELTPEDAAAIEASPVVAARFPYLALEARPGVAGLGILSRVRILGSSMALAPSVLEARLELPGGEAFTIINAHPFPPRYQVMPAVRIPLDYDARGRDADLVEIRRRVGAAIGPGDDRVILIGDFNVTDREPGYGDLAAGLWDAHREVGQGPGSTWRPNRLEFLPFGVLRIDYVFGGPGTRPLVMREDCSPRFSDHCVITATVALD
jgi:endonuclease/exonuclease/phosphatase family metal-dependent hydrolase